MGVFSVWMCCGEVEQEDTREEALSLAAALMNGDNHQVFAVEGPDGEDLTAEAEALARERSERWLAESRSRPKPIGRVEIAGPTGNWWGREFVYSDESRDRMMAEMTQAYGENRVRYVPTGTGI